MNSGHYLLSRTCVRGYLQAPRARLELIYLILFNRVAVCRCLALFCWYRTLSLIFGHIRDLFFSGIFEDGLIFRYAISKLNTAPLGLKLHNFRTNQALSLKFPNKQLDFVSLSEYNCTQIGVNMFNSLYISKSKIRRNLLALFFTNQSKKYYLRELQRILGHSAGSIRRELLKFQEDDLFETSRTGNLLYYSLNTKHPLFNELKSIVSKTVGLEGLLKDTLSSINKIKLAFIYGSFASNTEKFSSDIDIMIIGNPDFAVIHEKIGKLEKKLEREINPTIYSLSEYRTKKKDGSGFIEDLLDNPKIMLIGEKNDL